MSLRIEKRNPTKFWPAFGRLLIALRCDGIDGGDVEVPPELALPVAMTVRAALFGTEAELEEARTALAVGRHDLYGYTWGELAEAAGMSKKTMWEKRRKWGYK